MSFIGSGSAFSKKLLPEQHSRGQRRCPRPRGLRQPHPRGPGFPRPLGHRHRHLPRDPQPRRPHRRPRGGHAPHRYAAHRRPRIIVTDKLKRILWTMSLRGGASYNEVKNGSPLRYSRTSSSRFLKRRIAKADRELRRGPGRPPRDRTFQDQAHPRLRFGLGGFLPELWPHLRPARPLHERHAL